MTKIIIFPVFAAQDKGPFWFSNILNEILEFIEIWNEFYCLKLLLFDIKLSCLAYTS